MAVTGDILATYRGPRRVFARLLAMGPREDRMLAFLMAGCALMFISRMPSLAREAHLTGQEQTMLLSNALFGIIFVAPLALYTLALIAHFIARALRGTGESHAARLALFWSFLAASPLMLLNGLVAGMIGPGTELNLIGGLWFSAFLWFWISGMYQGYWVKPQVKA
ncbi:MULTISPECIES: YIP1 family protein [unclassified Pseudophaeobacter]|uniref:YIP1 family protein n=1 Tax=unclassified Pseudophaeobacter TaxID=2637024 RepID=UPI000EFAE5AF|nr:YIP1 family protein [Pseudophaeobacter sp. EL27]